MSQHTEKINIWTGRVAALSLLLLFFTIPHSLEDFLVGEPIKAGAPVLPLSYGVAGLIALQGLALFWIGQGKTRGFVIHAILGLLWPLAAGTAQLPVILKPGPYRSGTISEFLIFGMIVVGLLLCFASIQAWRTLKQKEI